MDETTVYIYTAADWTVLYVGVTGRGHARAEEHAFTKRWWRHVESAHFIHFKHRNVALDAESALIAALNPVGNTQHRGVGDAARIDALFVSAIRRVAMRRSAEHLNFALSDFNGPQRHIVSLPTLAERMSAFNAMDVQHKARVWCLECGRRRSEAPWPVGNAFCPDCWGHVAVPHKRKRRKVVAEAAARL